MFLFGLLVIVGLCIWFDAPLGITLGISGIAVMNSAYKLKKNGLLDGRTIFKGAIFLLGLALIVIGIMIHAKS